MIKKILLVLSFGMCLVFTSYAQVANQPSDLEVCDNNDFNDSDGFAVFDLTVLSSEVLAGQNPMNYEISYYETLADADAGSAIAIDPTNYTNITNSQTIYIRVTELATGNYDLTTTTLTVNPIFPSAATTPFEVCDDDNDGFAVFDLSIKENEIIGGDSSLTVSFYATEADANGQINQLPLVFMNVSNPQTIFVLVVSSFSNDCLGVTAFDLIAIDCTDTDGDGVIDSDEDINDNGNLDDDDTDMDMIPNYLDDDDDGDNVPTNVEINIASGRGLHPFVDTDMDLIENYLDDDDDGDNVLTINEDYNNNNDPTDDDTNNNNIPDYLDSTVALNLNDFHTLEFIMYPNPAKNTVMISLSEIFAENTTLIVFDIQGKQVLNSNINTIISELNTNNLESGIYFIQLKNLNSKSVQKLIIE